MDSRQVFLGVLRGAPSKSARVHRRAFSLAELVVVIAIIGIVSATAIPRFSSSLAKKRLTAAVQRLQRDFRTTRDRAIQLSAPQLIRFDEAACTYRLTPGSRATPGADVRTVCLSDEPYKISQLKVTVTPNSTLAFDGFGVPDQGGVVTMVLGDEWVTFNISTDTGLPDAPVFTRN